VRRALATGVLALSLVACRADPKEPDTAQPSPPTTSTGAPSTTAAAVDADARMATYPVPAGSRPHDVAPAPDGSVWYTAQATGELGRLDPATGATSHVRLGAGSAPHGVIVGPDGAPWVTDGGLNAIVRVDPATREVTRCRRAPATSI
jgi:virginiamycin B lyase